LVPGKQGWLANRDLTNWVCPIFCGFMGVS
jgi:hypothetical protein